MSTAPATDPARPDAPPRPPDTRFPELQGQRGLAALCIVFYVLVALLGAVLSRTAARAATPNRRLAPLVVAVAGLAAVSVAWWLVLGVAQDRPATDYPVWYGLPAELVVLATGMAAAVLVAVVPRTLGRAATWALRAAGAGAFVGAAALLVERGSGSRDWVFHALCGLAFAAVVLAGALGRPAGAWHRLSARGLLPWLGLVSCSLSLWREPLMLHLAGNGLLPAPSPGAFLPTVAVVAPAAVLAAWASYWVVEHPTSHLRVFLTQVPDRRLPLERRGAL